MADDDAPATTELDALDGSPGQLTLSTGLVIEIEDLKARQFFKFLRIITRGAMPNVKDMSLFKLDGDIDVRDFAGRLMSLVLLSIPEAENEAIEFVQAMCKPTGLIDRPAARLSKQDKERNNEMWTRFIVDLDNPELEDLVSIVEAIVKREAADIQALGKRLGGMFKMAEKTGLLDGSPTRTSQDANSSADSRGHSTWSRTSTAGTTTNSANSASVVYANSSQLSESGVTTSTGNETSG